MSKRRSDHSSERELRPPDPPGDTAALWRRRGVVVATAIGATLTLTLILSGASAAVVLYRLLTDGPLLALWLFSAWGWGTYIPFPIRDPRDQALRIVSGLALGLGMLSLLVLLLGAIGAIGLVSVWIVVLLGAVLAVARIIQLRARFPQDWLRAPVSNASWLWLALIPLASIVLVSAFVPPGILWGDEPHGYDVLEYHLQLPREWYESHRMTPVTHNAFSFMPLAVETHYLIAMELRGGAWTGMYLAQLMHATICALATVAVYAIAKAHDSPAATIAGVAVGATPWLALLAPVAYNEGGLLLFGTLAIGWTLRSLNDATPVRSLIMAGVFAGLACDAKLTAVPLLAIGLPVAVLVAAPGRLKLAGVFVAVIALVVFSPWLIRTGSRAGNPVFPEGQNVMGRAHFSAAQSQRWQRAHGPPEFERSLTGRLGAFADQVLLDKRFAFVLIPLALVSAATTWPQSRTRLLLALLVLLAIFWLSFTHLQGRFFVLAIPVAALMIGQLRSRNALRGALIVVALMTIYGTIQMSAQFASKVHPAEPALGIEDLRFFVSDQLQDAVTGSSRIALVGDARTFLYPVPLSRLHYRTVFDVDVRAGESIVDAWLRGAPDDAVVFVDPVELERFSKTYHAIPPLPPDFPGPRDHAFIASPR